MAPRRSWDSNYANRNATWYDPNLRNPYTMNWNGTYQYQFAQYWLLELSYQGSAGVGLLNSWNINAIHPDISSDRAARSDLSGSADRTGRTRSSASSITSATYGHSTSTRNGEG